LRYGASTSHRVSTFAGCAYGAVAISSWLVLDERISFNRAVGIAVVGIGLILVLR
jgi:uncharacterized membrane protein